jgi:hypothetical protein
VEPIAISGEALLASSPGLLKASPCGRFGHAIDPTTTPQKPAQRVLQMMFPANPTIFLTSGKWSPKNLPLFFLI